MSNNFYHVKVKVEVNKEKVSEGIFFPIKILNIR